MNVRLIGAASELTCDGWDWTAAGLLVGLGDGPSERNWTLIHGRKRYDDAEAQRFAEGLQRAVDRLPDTLDETVERPVVFPLGFAGPRKERLREIVALARAGAFSWEEEKSGRE
jgi:hypothetical protein